MNRVPVLSSEPITARGPGSRRRLVIVEPICRGSRLQVLAYALEALHQAFRITLLTRPDYRDTHYGELMQDLAPQIHVETTGVDLEGEWIRRLTWSEFSQYMALVKAIDAQLDEPFDLLFMAIDDYLPAFLMSGMRFRFKNVRRVWALKYRVDYLVGRRRSMRGRVLRVVTRTAVRMWRAGLITMDERLRSLVVGRRDVRILPDPWAGDFSPTHRTAARDRLSYRDADFVALAVGRQNERKGLSLLLASLDDLFNKIPTLVLALGPVEASFTDAVRAAVEKFGTDRIRVQGDFIPEEDLPWVFAAADVVLMPYHPSFAATSGVLARAAASGVQVVASSHGLVGSRVSLWDLGETFSPWTPGAFVDAVHEIACGPASASRIEGMHEFASGCSVSVFHGAIRAITDDSV